MEVIKKLSEISGLQKTEIKNIMLEVIENNKKLNSCDKHKFDIEIKRKWLCICCGGTINSTAKLWYEKGIKHGKI